MAYGDQDTFGTIGGVAENCARGEFTDVSNPTQGTVYGMMHARSSQIEATLRASGFTYTVPSGANPFPDPPSDFERTLLGLCDDAVEMGTAAQALLVSTESEMGSVPEKVAYWEQQWADSLKAIDALCRAPSSSSTRSAVGYAQLPTNGITPSTDW